jgi:hypothetical protein
MSHQAEEESKEPTNQPDSTTLASAWDPISEYGGAEPLKTATIHSPQMDAHLPHPEAHDQPLPQPPISAFGGTEPCETLMTNIHSTKFDDHLVMLDSHNQPLRQPPLSQYGGA